jgi:hypothetical protein
MSGLGILPIVAFGLYVLGAIIIADLIRLSLKWTVTSIKEVATPIQQTITTALPVIAIIGTILILPLVLQYIPKKR